MTIASTTNRNNYVGNGAVDTYAYSFRVLLQTDLVVTVVDSLGVETTLVLATDYTVTGVGEASGGNIVLVDASQVWLDGDGDLLTGYSLTVRRVVELTQGTDIRNQGDFFPETHEDQFDRDVMIAQQQQDEIDRAVKLPVTSTLSGIEMPEPGADEFLKFNNAGTALVTVSLNAGDGPNVQTVGDQTVDGSKTFIDTVIITPDEAEIALDVNQTQNGAGIDVDKSAGTGNAVEILQSIAGVALDVVSSANGDAVAIDKSGGTGSALDIGNGNVTVTQAGLVHTEDVVELAVISSPATPSSGDLKIFAKETTVLSHTEKNLYSKNSDGKENMLGMPVGSVIISVLSEANFQTQNGTGWVVMDGAGCVGTAYEDLTGFTTLPDAQGRFLRNFDQVTGTDPDSSALLTKIEDGIQDHGHQIHEMRTGLTPTGSMQKPNTRKSGLGCSDHNTSGDGVLSNGINAESQHMIKGIRTASPSARKNTNETVVKNIIMNHFIRIN